MSTQLKCDHGKETKAAGLRSRTIDLIERGEKLCNQPFLIASFKVDLCNNCEGGLVEMIRKYLHCKSTVPSLPEKGE